MATNTHEQQDSPSSTKTSTPTPHAKTLTNYEDWIPAPLNPPQDSAMDPIYLFHMSRVITTDPTQRELFAALARVQLLTETLQANPLRKALIARRASQSDRSEVKRILYSPNWKTVAAILRLVRTGKERDCVLDYIAYANATDSIREQIPTWPVAVRKNCTELLDHFDVTIQQGSGSADGNRDTGKSTNKALAG
ncbi:hypothetical protein NUU61_000979 [Penicillium alfredii]|uniref:Uncharacterized protein n=1 Tax=Penicillium alfredii TaxID=1506179 RepID=A0A9W9GBY0_9EURO|nr:uncharacterized protein NUU61_000979 [Penicillium alfredii]KAJ5115220.1 hypothetical protein NUU61_000979 [Penicillium alfredii]